MRTRSGLPSAARCALALSLLAATTTTHYFPRLSAAAATHTTATAEAPATSVASESSSSSDDADADAEAAALASVPVVDISPLLSYSPSSPGQRRRDDEQQELALRRMASDIRHALSTIGFMYIAGHGVSDSTVAKAFDASRRFFNLPAEEKRKLGIERSGVALRGWTDFFGENTDPERTLDHKEAFDLGRPPSDGVVRPFFGPTPWPPEDAAPGFRDDATTYHDEMMKLARRVMTGLALSLNLPGEYFDGQMIEPVATMRLLHYPGGGEGSGEGEEGGEEEGADAVSGETGGESRKRLRKVGIGAHTDYGCLTILAQDSVGGLQVLRRETDTWIDAPPVPGTFIVNIGDMIQRLTNDVYVATPHRVLTPGGGEEEGNKKERYSMPFFFDVDFDAVWEPLPQFVSEERPARYPPTKCGEHKWERYGKSYAHLKGGEEEMDKDGDDGGEVAATE